MTKRQDHIQAVANNLTSLGYHQERFWLKRVDGVLTARVMLSVDRGGLEVIVYLESVEGPNQDDVRAVITTGICRVDLETPERVLPDVIDNSVSEVVAYEPEPRPVTTHQADLLGYDYTDASMRRGEKGIYSC